MSISLRITSYQYRLKFTPRPRRSWWKKIAGSRCAPSWLGEESVPSFLYLKLYHLEGKPLLNGFFGVTKDEFKDGWEVYRLIMNLIPVNKICRNLGGDLSTLPNWAGMSSFLLGDGQVTLMSSEDIRCFFYLFSVPPAWLKYLGFNKLVPSGALPPELRDTECVLVSRVLPMGFLNSVSIAQHVHRRVARLALRAGPNALGPQDEIRRDGALPSSQNIYRVYLDNFDVLEKVDGPLAQLIEGTPSTHSLKLREQYALLGLPSEENCWKTGYCWNPGNGEWYYRESYS